MACNERFPGCRRFWAEPACYVYYMVGAGGDDCYIVAITVEDPREHTLPEAGWIELDDAETGRRVLIDTGNRALRQRVERLAEQRRDDRRRVLLAAGVDHLELETGQDYKLPLRRHFAMRARRVGRR